jgi:CCR4-NOT transcription complex subunit 6
MFCYVNSTVGSYLEYRWYKSVHSFRCAFNACPYSTVNKSAPNTKSKFQCMDCVQANRTRGLSSFCSTECFKAGWLEHKSTVHTSNPAGPRKGRGPPSSFDSPFEDEDQVLIDPRRFPPLEEESWVQISREKVYNPTKTDVGHLLRIECIAHSDTDGKVIGNKVVETSLVLPTPPPVLTRTFIESKMKRSVNYSTFRVISYNILADIYGTQQLYPYCPVWALRWNYRRGNILRELLQFDADILCLQEVQADHFEKFLYPELKRCNYEGLYKAKTRPSLGQEGKVDGCALFYRTDRFKLKEKYVIEFNEVAAKWKDDELKKAAGTCTPAQLAEKEKLLKRGVARLSKDNVAQLAVLESVYNPAMMAAGRYPPPEPYRLCVANTHIFWDPDYPDVKLWQTNMLVKELEKFTQARQVPLVLCGDLNSEPSSSVYELLSRQSVSHDHVDLEKDVCAVLPHIAELCHNLPLASAYFAVTDAEPEHTNFTGHYKGVLDYVWFSQDSLLPMSVVEVPDANRLQSVANSALPNAIYSSDHLSLCADFAVIPRRR